MKIKNMPDIDKPREKMLRYGPSKLSDRELIAILLDTGTSKKDVLQLAGDVEKWLNRQNSVELKELLSIKGLGIAKAGRIAAAIELGKRFSEKRNTGLTSPEIVWHSCMDIARSKKEQFVVFYLDARYRQIERQVISVGLLTESLVHPREVFETAVRLSCAAVILVHNHPSGELTPSDGDIKVTERLVKAGNILGIDVLDHVIISKDGFLSMKQELLI